MSPLSDDMPVRYHAHRRHIISSVSNFTQSHELHILTSVPCTIHSLFNGFWVLRPLLLMRTMAVNALKLDFLFISVSVTAGYPLIPAAHIVLPPRAFGPRIPLSMWNSIPILTDARCRPTSFSQILVLHGTIRQRRECLVARCGGLPRR